MESFTEPHSKKPITQIQISEGETKILGIRKFDLGPPPEVIVTCLDSTIAFCHQVCKLNKPKNAYEDHYDLLEVAQDTTPVDVANNFYFQICGKSVGTTKLTATFLNQSANADPYAVSLPISVTANSKLLRFVPSASFDTLWSVHPYNPAVEQSKFTFQLCTPKLHLGCMVRFCTTLKRGGVNLDRFVGTKCGLPGKEHAHHFTNPYDFESWHKLGNAFVWEAKSPFQPEPMPGFAAFFFVAEKKGVILFWNYFSTVHNMFGGHIDLWNKNRMGNTFSSHEPIRGESAFARARKIVFWPLE